MGILLAFASFIIFAVADSYLGITDALMAGAAVALILALREVLIRRKSPKLLEAGTVLLFGGLWAYSMPGKPDWSIFVVRLMVDAGLIAIVLASIIIRRSFTLQFAREQTPREIWDKPVFIQATMSSPPRGSWLSFHGRRRCADGLCSRGPHLDRHSRHRPRIGEAIGFTGWYPMHAQAKAEAAAKSLNAQA